MHENNLGIMDTCSWATPTVEEEVEPPTQEESPIRSMGTYQLDTTVQEGTYHSYHHGCLQRAEGQPQCASTASSAGSRARIAAVHLTVIGSLWSCIYACGYVVSV